MLKNVFICIAALDEAEKNLSVARPINQFKAVNVISCCGKD